MIRTISLIVSLGLGMGACVSQPAPGTRPSDMTAQAHVQECRKHAKIADAQDQRYKEGDRARGIVTLATPTVGAPERHVASQHEQAAKALDPNAPDCP
jgi:hypothetical protein